MSLNIFKNFYSWKNPIEKIKFFLRSCAMVLERAKKGYCRWDLYDFDKFILRNCINGLREFTQINDKIPGYMYEITKVNDETTLKLWNNKLEEIAMFLEASQRKNWFYKDGNGESIIFNPITGDKIEDGREIDKYTEKYFDIGWAALGKELKELWQ